jgi:alanine racemase
MDQVVIQLPDDSDACGGDEVELFGANISATQVAEQAGTIAWEIFTGITPRVQRIYLPES